LQASASRLLALGTIWPVVICDVVELVSRRWAVLRIEEGRAPVVIETCARRDEAVEMARASRRKAERAEGQRPVRR
jgi:hypothetical protein